MSLEVDPDLAAEAISADKIPKIALPSDVLSSAEAARLTFVPLGMNGNSFAKSWESSLLLRRIGGG